MVLVDISIIPYVKAFVTFMVFAIASKIAIFLLNNTILRLTEKTRSRVDDLIIKGVSNYFSIILILIGARLAIIPLGMEPQITDYVEKVIFSAIVIVISLIITKIADILIDSWLKNAASKTKSKIDDNIVNLIHRIFRFIFIILALLYILDYWGLEIGPLLTGLGIAGLAVALALQVTLSNVFGGVSLIVDKSVKIGDVIELDPETKGTVIDVGLRSTKIRTFNNELVIIPNGKLSDSKFINYTLPDLKVRVVIPFSVAYGSKVEKVKKVVLKEIKKIDGLLDDPPPLVRFIEMGGSSLNFKAYFWVNDFNKRFESIDMANMLIYDALNKAGISIPFPQLDVHIKKK